MLRISRAALFKCTALLGFSGHGNNKKNRVKNLLQVALPAPLLRKPNVAANRVMASPKSTRLIATLKWSRLAEFLRRERTAHARCYTYIPFVTLLPSSCLPHWLVLRLWRRFRPPLRSLFLRLRCPCLQVFEVAIKRCLANERNNCGCASGSPGNCFVRTIGLPFRHIVRKQALITTITGLRGQIDNEARLSEAGKTRLRDQGWNKVLEACQQECYRLPGQAIEKGEIERYQRFGRRLDC